MERPQPVLDRERLLMMAIELEHGPDCVLAAAGQLADEDLPALVRIVRRAPPDSRLASRIWQDMLDSGGLRALLEDERVDRETLDHALASFGPEEAGTLLDLLCEAESLPTRRRLLERLSELAPRIERELIRRASDDRWYARRNILVLMGELEKTPPKWSPASLADDPHPSVRREAFKLMLREPDLRDRALCGLLQDRDPRARALGLAAATESCPPEAIPLLAALVRDASISTEQRVMGLRALGRSGDPEAVTPLVKAARRGSGLAPNRLAEKGPLMLAALQALATFPGDIGAGRKLIARASRSSDPDVRAALGRERSP